MSGQPEFGVTRKVAVSVAAGFMPWVGVSAKVVVGVSRDDDYDYGDSRPRVCAISCIRKQCHFTGNPLS